MDFAVLADLKMKIEISEKIDNYMDLARERLRTMEHESDSNTNYSSCTWNVSQSFVKKCGGTENARKCRGNKDQNIFKIGMNTEKCFWDLNRFTVTNTPVTQATDSIVKILQEITTKTTLMEELHNLKNI